MNTPQTDTPETDAACGTGNWIHCVDADFARTLERRALAAEARLAKWESELSKVMPADFKDWWQNSREEWPEVARMVIEGLRKQVEMTDKAAEARVKELEAIVEFEETCQTCNVSRDPANVEAGDCIWCIADQFKRERDESRAALRLRPIAEAGPVPDGAVRVYARFFKELSEWVFSASLNDAIHFIDIYPPQQ